MKNMQTINPEDDMNDLEIPELTADDFARAVPYRKIVEAKKSTTIRLKTSTIYYFQLMSQQTGIPYQTLINMYLDDCAKNQRKIHTIWE